MKKIIIVFMTLFLGEVSLSQGLGWVVLSPNFSSAEATFTSVDTGFIFHYDTYNGYYPYIERTIDGGNNWKGLKVLDSVNFYNAYFANSQTIFLWDNFTILLKSINGGKTWDTVNVGSDIQHIDQIHFLTPSIFFITANSKQGTILQSTYNSGENWDRAILKDYSGFDKIFFKDSLHGFAVVSREFSMCGIESYLLETVDAGKNWTLRESNYHGGCPIYHGNSWLSFEEKNVSTWTEDFSLRGSYQVFQNNNESITSLSFTTDLVGYATSYEGRIFKTIDGGKTWSVQSTPSQYTRASKITATSEKIVYAVGEHILIKTTDGGGSLIGSAVPANTEKSYFYLAVYPNSSISEFRFSTLEAQKIFQIYDILGKELFHTLIPAGESKLQINLQTYNPGVFFARLGNNTVKLIKN